MADKYEISIKADYRTFENFELTENEFKIIENISQKLNTNHCEFSIKKIND